MRAGMARAEHGPATFRFTSATFAHPHVPAKARAGLALESALERVRHAGIEAISSVGADAMRLGEILAGGTAS